LGGGGSFANQQPDQEERGEAAANHDIQSPPGGLPGVFDDQWNCSHL
jgi:hypothetical protein